MKFFPTPTDENFPLDHWISEEKKWEMGFVRMIFGVRVRVGRVGKGYVVLDLCAGADSEFRNELLCCVMIILLPVSEDITEGELEKLFPQCNRKPIFNDPCWPKMQKMARDILHISYPPTNRKFVEINPEPNERN